jgi:VanZ family protein
MIERDPMSWMIGWRLAFYGCAAAILVLALSPITGTIPTTGWDKADHFLAFAGLALLGMKAFPKDWVACMGGVLAFGIAVELLQAAVPYRFAELRDIAADALGIAIGMAATRLLSFSPPVERPATPKRRLP